MLNELKEYEEYSGAFETSGVRRLSYRNLINNNLTGLSRAMTIVARYWLYRQDLKEAGTLSVPDIPYGTNALKLWAGDPTADRSCLSSSSELSAIDNWFPKYLWGLTRNKYQEALPKITEIWPDSVNSSEIVSFMVSEDFLAIEKNAAITAVLGKYRPNKNPAPEFKGLPDSCKQFLKCLGILRSYMTYNVRELFPQELFPKDPDCDSKTETGINNLNQVSYSRIIASALDAGPLRQYYLEEYLINDLPAPDPDGLPIFKKDKTGEKRYILLDHLHRFTAAVLLARSSERQAFVCITNADLLNWTPNISKWENFNFSCYSLSGKELISGIQVSGNRKLYTMAPEWLRHFSIIPRDQFDPATPSLYAFYSDFGSSEPLRKNVLYDQS